MKRKNLGEEEEQYSVSRSAKAEWVDPGNKNSKRGQQYKCGKSSCGKVYHSYTAFYNHCKKNHSGQFPAGSLINDKPFEGPSKNRGRPRIKKNDAKDQIQIQSMKTQNELIEFLGTLKSKKNQQLVVYVQNPYQRFQSAIKVVREWDNSESISQYLKELSVFDKLVTDYDLPEFYDPIEIDNLKDNMDSYNFNSIYSFMTNQEKIRQFDIKDQGKPLLRKILVAWLARILSEKLLAQVIYAVAQIHFETEKMTEKELLGNGKSNSFRNIITKFFQCFLTEHRDEDKLEQYDDS